MEMYYDKAVANGGLIRGKLFPPECCINSASLSFTPYTQYSSFSFMGYKMGNKIQLFIPWDMSISHNLVQDTAAIPMGYMSISQYLE